MKRWLSLVFVAIGCGQSNADDLFGPSNPGAGATAGSGNVGGGETGGTAGLPGAGTDAGGLAGTMNGGTAGDTGGAGTGGDAGTSGGGSGGSSGTTTAGTGGTAGTAGGGTAGTAGGGTAGTAGGGTGGTGGTDGGAGGVSAGGEGGSAPCTDERCDGLDNDCSGTPDDAGACPAGCSGFADADDHGYMICLPSTDLNFDEAQAACQAHDPTFNLAQIESEPENTFLVNSVMSLTDAAVSLWIGATDSDDEGAWYWLDGTYFYDDVAGMPIDDAYNAWADQRPNDLGSAPGEDCGALVVNDGAFHARWNDLQCTDDDQPYICEAAD